MYKTKNPIPPYRRKIKELLKKFSARKLAQKLDVDITAIWRWDNGKSKPMPIFREKIRRLYKKGAR